MIVIIMIIMIMTTLMARTVRLAGRYQPPHLPRSAGAEKQSPKLNGQGPTPCNDSQLPPDGQKVRWDLGPTSVNPSKLLITTTTARLCFQDN